MREKAEEFAWKAHGSWLVAEFARIPIRHGTLHRNSCEFRYSNQSKLFCPELLFRCAMQVRQKSQQIGKSAGTCYANCVTTALATERWVQVNGLIRRSHHETHCVASGLDPWRVGVVSKPGHRPTVREKAAHPLPAARRPRLYRCRLQRRRHQDAPYRQTRQVGSNTVRS